MSQRTIAVTGALGCIGAWVVRRALDAGDEVIAIDHGGSQHRLNQLLSNEELATLVQVDCDVRDATSLGNVFAQRFDAVVHLAALQVPTCRVNPKLGAEVNVVGTLNVFEAVRETQPETPIVFASSVAAYAAADAANRPFGDAATLYGVFKRANEGTAKVFGADAGIRSVGLRPYTVYGVGRDFGLTSGPTTALAAALCGQPYTVQFGGSTWFQLADDVAGAFIKACERATVNAEVYDLPGQSVSVADFLSAVSDAIDKPAELLHDGQSLPFPIDLDPSSFLADISPDRPTPLYEGISRSLAHFAALQSEGRIDLAELVRQSL